MVPNYTTMPLRFSFYNHIQVRAYNGESLIGNIGGYIGLFLGYTILQLPDLLIFLYQQLSRMYHKHINSKSYSSHSSWSIVNVSKMHKLSNNSNNPSGSQEEKYQWFLLMERIDKLEKSQLESNHDHKMQREMFLKFKDKLDRLEKNRFTKMDKIIDKNGRL